MPIFGKKKDREISQIPKSVFISYARDNDEFARFVLPLADWLQERGCEVAVDKGSLEMWPEFMKRAMTSDNVLFVSTEMYNYTCLMGNVQSNKQYAKYPSFTFEPKGTHSGKLDDGVEYAMKVAFTVYGMIQKGELKSTMFSTYKDWEAVT